MIQSKKLVNGQIVKEYVNAHILVKFSKLCDLCQCEADGFASKSP